MRSPRGSAPFFVDTLRGTPDEVEHSVTDLRDERDTSGGIFLRNVAALDTALPANLTAMIETRRPGGGSIWLGERADRWRTAHG